MNIEWNTKKETVVKNGISLFAPFLQGRSVYNETRIEQIGVINEYAVTVQCNKIEIKRMATANPEPALLEFCKMHTELEEISKDTFLNQIKSTLRFFTDCAIDPLEEKENEQ